VKRCVKIISSFLPAFLLALSVAVGKPHMDTNRTRQKARDALSFCRQKGYNTRYCILIDMSLPSGVKRFVVWDFREGNILISGLISHGCGKGPWSGVWSKDKPAFSNLDGSHCTALGKYQVDGRAYSAWGIHIKYYLTGLESTNNNALARQIVFHSWTRYPRPKYIPTEPPKAGVARPYQIRP